MFQCIDKRKNAIMAIIFVAIFTLAFVLDGCSGGGGNSGDVNGGSSYGSASVIG